ncbi:kit ligand a [Xiphophorus couchianus]|uniref:kit ligand a n=1 Tax=Xiphophorus couchianus TaxID=32473 RepID=UPI00101656C8|nr:kit ligand-like [Xiphophorus couchianus]
MKKSKSWIDVCVHFLLFMTLGVHSAATGKVVNDIDRRVPDLRQNIPKDYKIPIKFIPKETGDMCWAKLNLYYLEESLKDLSEKFGNISSNKLNIQILIQFIEEKRIGISNMNPQMLEFECHYRVDKWETGKYFNFVEEVCNTADRERPEEECDPPPCPTTPIPTEKTISFQSTSGHDMSYNIATKDITRSSGSSPSPLRQVVEKSLFSLLFVPLLALIFLLVWKVRSRRNVEHPRSNRGEEEGFTEPHLMAPRQDGETSEKNALNLPAEV